MKNYFNKQERQDLLTLEAARASFDRLIGHDLIPEPDKDRLRIAKLSLDNALPDIAERVPESARRQIESTFKSHRFAIAPADKIRTETTTIGIDARDDLLSLCVGLACEACDGSSDRSRECPIAILQREALIDPVSDDPDKCEYNQ